MIIKIDRNRKIFIAGAIISAVAICACSAYISFTQSERSAMASGIIKNITVRAAAGNPYRVGGEYSVSWDSECRGGQAMVWLSTASSSQANIDILVPLLPFSAANFGTKGQDDRIFFSDPWQFIQSINANKGKTSWTVPAQLDLAKTSFGSGEGVFYIYSLADGRYALHKIVEQPVQMPVLADNYYLRVDVKGSNGCEAVGYSQLIKIIDR